MGRSFTNSKSYNKTLTISRLNGVLSLDEQNSNQEAIKIVPIQHYEADFL